MLAKDAKPSMLSLKKVKQICFVLNVVMWLVFIVLSVFWCISMGAMFLSLFSVDQSGNAGITIFNLTLCLVFGIVIATMFVIFTQFFRDVAKEESPFSLTQVSRLRVISALLVAYFLIDTIIANNSLLMQINGFSAGYMTTNTNTIFTVDFGSFIVAAVVFAFSFVFKYGVLLQEFSDETL